MPEYWSPPEQAASDRQRVTRWRQWLLPLAGGIGAALVVFVGWAVWRLIETVANG